MDLFQVDHYDMELVPRNKKNIAHNSILTDYYQKTCSS